MNFWDTIGEMVTPFYLFGVVIWNFMLDMIGMTAATTPMKFSTVTWKYVINDLQPWFFAIGAILLNISYYIGIIRSAGNLKQEMTMEYFIECCTKVVLANAVMLSINKIMRILFGIAGTLSSAILLDTPVIFIQSEKDLGSTLFYMLMGVIYFAVCLVCSGTIFLVVYGRYLRLYMLVATAPVAFGALPGGSGMSQTTYAWIRTFLSKTFEIVIIAVAITIAAKMCNSIDFGKMEGAAGVFNGAVQAIQNTCTMVLVASAVKGADVFMRRTFAL